MVTWGLDPTPPPTNRHISATAPGQPNAGLHQGVPPPRPHWPRGQAPALTPASQALPWAPPHSTAESSYIHHAFPGGVEAQKDLHRPLTPSRFSHRPKHAKPCMESESERWCLTPAEGLLPKSAHTLDYPLSHPGPSRGTTPAHPVVPTGLGHDHLPQLDSSTFPRSGWFHA